MFTNNQSTTVEELDDLEIEFIEAGDSWRTIFASMVQNSFEVGRNLQEVLVPILKSVLMLVKAEAGIILLQSDDGRHLVEVASYGFSGEHPIIVRKNHNIDKSILAHLSDVNKASADSLSIINLNTGGVELGIIAIYLPDSVRDDREVQALLEHLKKSIADGIKRTREFDIVKRRDLLTKASLMQLGKSMGSALDIKKLSRQITQATMATIEADLCDILLLKDRSLEFQVASGFNKILKGFGNVPLKKDPAASIVKNGNPVVIKNIRSKSRFNERPWLNREQFKSYVGVPIKQDDETIGVLEAFSRNASKFTKSDLKILQSLAGPVAASLKNANLFEETRKKAEELKILHMHMSQIVTETDIGKVMEAIVNAAREAVGSLMAAAALFNTKTGHFEHRTFSIDPTLGSSRVLNGEHGVQYSYTEEAYAKILRSGRALRLDDIRLLKQGITKTNSRMPLRGFLGVPLVDQNKNPCGIVMVSFKKDGSLFTEADEEVLTTLANQASIAIQNAQLYSQLEYRARALKNIFSVGQKISASHDSKKIQKAVINAVSNLFGARSVCIALFDESDRSLKISKCLIDGVEQFAGKKLSIEKEKRITLFDKRKPVLIARPSFIDKLKIDNKPLGNYFKSFIGIPLVVQNRAIGILGMSSNLLDDSFVEDELELMQIFANKVAIAIDNSRLYEKALAEAENLATTLEISKVITSETDLNAIFKQITLAIKKIFKIKHGSIFLSDKEGQKLIHTYRWGVGTPVPKRKVISVEDSPLVGQSFIHKKQIMVNDISRYDTAACGKSSLSSVVFIPLVVKGEACGVIAMFSKEMDSFDKEKLSLMNIFINQFAIAIRNNQLYTRVMEEEVARREAELSVQLLEEKAKNAIVIEETAEGIFMIDPDYRVQLFNPAMEKLTGKSMDKVIGRKCYEVFKDIYYEGTPCDECPMNVDSKQQEKVKGSIRHRSGEIKYIEISRSQIESSGSRGVIGTVRDITKDHELEIYQHDLRIATEVQKNILPQVRPEVKGLDIGFMCKPAKQIGGDYFDFIPLDNDKVGIAIGDVAGKSLPAALLVSMHKYILRSAAANTSSVISPLRSVNQIIWEDTSPEVFVTTIYGIYNPRTTTFVYANAGHLPPLLYSGGSAKYLWAPQTPLGIQQNLLIEQQQIKLNSGDVLVLLSDGVTDVRNSKGECFGFERLRRIVKKYVNIGCQELADLIYEQTTKFAKGELADDFTIVVLKCTKEGEETPVKELVVANKPIAVNDVRRFVSAELKKTPFSTVDISDILVAVCEAVTNSVLHGQSPDGENNNIKISCSYENSSFEIKISDNGIGYNPNLPEWQPPDLVRDRGRGIFLMQQLMDGVEFAADDRGATVILTKKYKRRFK